MQGIGKKKKEKKRKTVKFEKKVSKPVRKLILTFRLEPSDASC